MQLPARVTSQDVAQVWDRYDKHKRGELTYNKAHKFVKELAHVAGLKYDKAEADRLIRAVTDTSDAGAAAVPAHGSVSGMGAAVVELSAAAASVPRSPRKAASNENVRVDFERFRRLFLVVLEKEREQHDNPQLDHHQQHHHQQLLTGLHKRHKGGNNSAGSASGGHVRRQLSSSLQEVQRRMNVNSAAYAATSDGQETPAANAPHGRSRWQTLGEDDEEEEDEKEKENTANQYKAATIGATAGAAIAEAMKLDRKKRETMLGKQRRMAATAAAAHGGDESLDSSRTTAATDVHYRTWDHVSTLARREHKGPVDAADPAGVPGAENLVARMAFSGTIETRRRGASSPTRESTAQATGAELDRAAADEAVVGAAGNVDSGDAVTRGGDRAGDVADGAKPEEARQQREKNEESDESKSESEGDDVAAREEKEKKECQEQTTVKANEMERTEVPVVRQSDKAPAKVERKEESEQALRGLRSPRRGDQGNPPELRHRVSSPPTCPPTCPPAASCPPACPPAAGAVKAEPVPQPEPANLGEDNLVSVALVLIHLASPLVHRHFLVWLVGLAVLVSWLLLARTIRILYLRASIKQRLADTAAALSSTTTTIKPLAMVSSPTHSRVDRMLLALHQATIGPLMSPRVGVFAYGAVCFGLASFSSAHDPSLTALLGLALPTVILGCCRWKHDVPTDDPFNLLSFADGATVFGIITGSLIAVSGLVGYMVVCTSLAISVPLATWHTRRWLHGLKPSGVSFVRDFLMAVVIYPLVGATVFVACMALSFFVSGLLLSLVFGQMFIGDWSVTLRTVFQFILLTGLVFAIMIGQSPHALLHGGSALGSGWSRPLVTAVSVLCLLCTAMTALTLVRTAH